MGLFSKTSPRRNRVRKSLSGERASWFARWIKAGVVTSAALWGLFVAGTLFVLSLGRIQRGAYVSLTAMGVLVVLLSTGAAVYVRHYQSRVLTNRARATALVGLLLCALAVTKIGVSSARDAIWATSWGTGSAVVVAVILTIAYEQRFALGMSILYCLLASLAAGQTTTDPYGLTGIGLLLTMAGGAISCCFCLHEIRTRMKLLRVGTLAAAVVFVTACAVGVMDYLEPSARWVDIVVGAGYHAAAAFLVVLLIQSLLPVIEKLFRIATSMTLLDYTDANQPLLKRLAMDAPGTFSHSLLIGSVAEAAAETIGANGLLCRVGAYYHDIGKLNKPKYFIENEMGSESKHAELSPTMSQLVIAGHVKDGVEMAKEYGLPVVLRQFIETHHGTTLLEPFYDQAKKKHDASAAAASGGGKPKEGPPSESEFRYAGPKPRSKEAAIVMLADTVEGAVRSLSDATPAKVEAVVHNMAMRRLRDGQFDECDLTLRELSQIEKSMAKSLAAHYHGRIPYPTAPDDPGPPTSEQQTAREPVASKQT